MKRSLLLILALAALLCICLASGCDVKEMPTEQTPTETETEDTTPKDGRFRSDELGKYVIVYGGGTDYYSLALKLERAVYAKYGQTILTVRDSRSTPSEYEILLGDTNRRDTYGRVMEYSVSVDGKTLVIDAGGAFSAEEAVNYICEDLLNGDEFALESGEYCKRSFLSEPTPVTDGSAARVMSANLLAQSFAGDSYRSPEYRAEIFAGMLVTYTPDVLGLQETDAGWNNALDKYLQKIEKAHGVTYTRLLATYDGKLNYTSLLYRSDKLKVNESGLTPFSWWVDAAFSHSYHMRNLSWASFSPLDDTDKTFIVANTHWSYRTEHADGKTYLSGSERPIEANELRLQCVNETSEILSALLQSHPQTPIFLTGDFNTSLSVFSSPGWTPVQFSMISEEARESGSSLSTVPETGHFDHIFGAGDYSIKRYEFFKDSELHALLTDHPFVYADLDF